MSNSTWGEWGSKDTGAIAPGVYTVKVHEVVREYGHNGIMRTSMDMVIAEGQPHAGRHLWDRWPHDAKMGWKARRAWDACRLAGEPRSQDMDEIFNEVADVLASHGVGAVLRATVATRTYQNAHGEQVQSSDVKRLEAPPQSAEPAQPAAPQYGGRTDVPQW